MPIGEWKADRESTKHDAWRAKVLLALRAASPGLGPAELDLPIPQSGCCFAFGAKESALPAGAVLQLWAKDPNSTGACPVCGGLAVATGFGGLLSVGGYKCLCLSCARPLFRWIGGLGAVCLHVRPLFEGTPWFLNGARFGGVFASDGAALAEALGQPKAPEGAVADGPVVKVGEARLDVAVKAEGFEDA
jgi:hypothetical protein